MAVIFGMDTVGDHRKKVQQPSFWSHLVIDHAFSPTWPGEGRDREVSLQSCQPASPSQGLQGTRKQPGGAGEASQPDSSHWHSHLPLSCVPQRELGKERPERRQREEGAGAERRKMTAMTDPKEQRTGELQQWSQALAGGAHEA